jgi:hypothetical protein
LAQFKPPAERPDWATLGTNSRLIGPKPQKAILHHAGKIPDKARSNPGGQDGDTSKLFTGFAGSRMPQAPRVCTQKGASNIFPPFEQATMSHRSVLLLASANSPFCDFRDGAQSCDWTNYRRVIELRIAGVFPVAVPDALRVWHLSATYPMVHDWPKNGSTGKLRHLPRSGALTQRSPR